MARLIVLDEDPALRRFLSIFLESLGHRVRLDAGSGNLALAAIAREPEGFDAIVSDLRLPIADGLDVLAGTRALAGELGPVPVILASNAWTEDEVALARGLGAEAVLKKPLDLDRLAREVVRVAFRPDELVRPEYARPAREELA